MPVRFKNKVVVVTGATRGIGRATAERLASDGATVVVAGTRLDRAESVAAALGGNAMGVEVDVGDERSCQKMFERTLAQFGRLDVLVNNAGIAGGRSLAGDRDSESWQRVLDVNLNGVFYCSRAAIQHMSSDGGVIINIASVDGLVGMAGLQHYAAAKHGVIGFTKSLALEYGRNNIRAVAVAPGYIQTDMTAENFSDTEAATVAAMTALGRAAEPIEVAHMIAWLASDEASYVTGCCLQVDGGLLSGFGALE